MMKSASFHPSKPSVFITKITVFIRNRKIWVVIAEKIILLSCREKEGRAAQFWQGKYALIGQNWRKNKKKHRFDEILQYFVV
ncbi:MAG: hypothetical protein K5893_11350 [Prevotella sp.]|nr:hypothetical protein [Prevotella sp.]